MCKQIYWEEARQRQLCILISIPIPCFLADKAELLPVMQNTLLNRFDLLVMLVLVVICYLFNE